MECRRNRAALSRRPYGARPPKRRLRGRYSVQRACTGIGSRESACVAQTAEIEGGILSKVLDIWQPRWHDRTVLIACTRVHNGDNVITFSKTPSLPGRYHIDGALARSYPVASNGKILCYVVPLADLVGEEAKPAQGKLW